MKPSKLTSPAGQSKRAVLTIVVAAGPRDDQGRFVKRDCPVCGDGTLQPQGDGFWQCDGLIDPPRGDMELEACLFGHESGTPYQSLAAAA